MLLAARRVVHRSVRRTTTVMDVVMYLALGMVVLLGIWATVGVSVLVMVGLLFRTGLG